MMADGIQVRPDFHLQRRPAAAGHSLINNKQIVSFQSETMKILPFSN